MTRVDSTTWRMLAYRGRHEKLPRGLDAMWDAGLGMVDRLRKSTAGYLKRADAVLALEDRYGSLSNDALRDEAVELRRRFRRGRDTADDLEHGFALVREVAWRRLGEKPHREQVAGALAIAEGCIAEMATGEGKTLTATMPATIAGWRGRGCHVITVNDYLARRDAEWMAKVYRFCGVTVAAIDQDTEPPARHQGYLADVTYLTNKEVAADFLRDRLALGRLGGLPEVILQRLSRGRAAGIERVVQRGLACAIIDEADSVLIDEAVTPLIISGDAPNPEQVDAFGQAAELADQLQPGRHYTVSARYREVELTRRGRTRVAELAEGLGTLWQGVRRREELVTQAISARELFENEKQYVIQDDKVVIVDESTGRLMPDRQWRDGLHQAVSAKEGLEVEPPKDTYARISFQRFFRQYRKLSGMTGTAAEASREFWQIFHLPVVVVPTHRRCIRVHEPDRVFARAADKWDAVVHQIERVHATGQPVLVGTRSVEDSERLGRRLAERGLEHNVLNAVRIAEEARIVAEAGGLGKITVATNMAGRGTDIKLGRHVAEKGGLFVLAAERNDSGRVDRQLFGRSGRQGDPGRAQAFVSLEDDLLTRHAPKLSAALRRRYGGAHGELDGKLLRRVFDLAQRHARKMALRQRKQVLETDHWLDEYLGFAGRER